MKDVAVWIGGVRLPINPPEISYKVPTEHARYTLLGIGEVNVLRKAKLAEVRIEGLLPPHKIPGVNEGALPPMEYIHMWQRMIEDKQPVGTVYVGSDWDFSMNAGLENLDFTEKGGAVGWIEFSLLARKWVPYQAKSVSVNNTVSKPRTQNAPEASPLSGGSYTVQEGDSLWRIAQAMLGDGSRWQEIYNLNEAAIKNPNLIFPGQELIMPDGANLSATVKRSTTAGSTGGTSSGGATSGNGSTANPASGAAEVQGPVNPRLREPLFPDTYFKPISSSPYLLMRNTADERYRDVELNKMYSVLGLKPMS